MHAGTGDSVLYVLDRQAQQVRTFDALTGKERRTIGEGSGEGPGEMQKTEQLAIAREGKLLITDLTARAVHVFDASGTFERSLPVGAASPVDVAERADGGWWVHTSPTPTLFSIYDDEEHLKDVGSIGATQADGIGKNGLILSDPETGDLVYSARMAGRLLQLTPDGKVAFYRKTITPNDFSKPRSIGNGTFTVDQSNLRAVRELVGLTDDAIYITAFLMGELASEHLMVVDRYDRETGDYLYSFAPFNDGCAVRWVTAPSLFTTCDRGASIERWARD